MKKKTFLVKVQLAVLSDPDNSPIMIYDQKRSFHGHLHTSSALHAPLVEAVKVEGVMGLKGYFNARIEGEKLLVNPKKIQAPQTW